MENGKEHSKRQRFFAVFIFVLLTCIVVTVPFFIIAAIDPHHEQHEFGGGDEIDVTGLSGLLADAQKVAVSKNSGAIIGTRAELNFIEGSNITLTITDDAVNGEVDIEIEATGGGGGAPVDATYVVFEADATLTQEKILGTQVIVDGLDASIPLAGVEGRLYWATDTKKFYRDNGAGWDFILSLDHALLSNLTTGDPHTQYQLEVQKGVAGGYASLDGGGTIPLAEIPATITRDAEWNTEGEVETIWGLDIFTSGDGALSDDDLSDNSIEDLSDVTAMAPNDNDVLTWNTAESYWEAQPAVGGSAIWGDITGTLSDQTDLQNALNDKLESESDPVYSGDPAAGIASGDITNWNTAYGWGDHAGLYDTVGTASGLMGTHQSTYDHTLIATALQDLSGLTTDDLTEGSSNKYFPGFTDLLTDYGFTDNSSDWNTAFGWGNHATAGYLTDITGESIGDLSDVDLTGITDGKILKWDTGEFVVADDATGGGGVSDLNEAYEGGSTVTVDVADVIWDLTSTQDFVVKDNGTAVATVTDGGVVNIDIAGGVADGFVVEQLDDTLAIGANRFLGYIHQEWEGGASPNGALVFRTLKVHQELKRTIDGGGGLFRMIAGRTQEVYGYLTSSITADITGAWATYIEGVFGGAYDTGGDFSTQNNTKTAHGLNFEASLKPYQVNKAAGTLTGYCKGVQVTATTDPGLIAGTFIAYTYGGVFSAIGTTEGTQTAYGIYSSATGADTNYAGYFVGDVYVGGKIDLVGVVDPPAVLYDYETRESIIERVMYEVPPEKLDGAVVFYNGDVGRLEMFIPALGEFRSLNGILMEQVDPIKETFEIQIMYRFDTDRGEVFSYQAPVKDEWQIKGGVMFDNATGKFYEKTEEGIKTDKEVDTKDAIEYREADDTGITPVEPKP